MKYDNIVSKLVALAEDNQKQNPDMKSYHAAAIIRNGSKVISCAVNHPRSYVKGKSGYTMHAEAAVIHSVFGRDLYWKGRWILSKVAEA